MSNDKEVDTEKYQGPGRFTAAIGKGVTIGVAGEVVGAVAGGLVGLVTASKNSPQIQDLGSAGVLLTGAEGKAVRGVQFAIVTGALVGAVAGIYGLYKGWTNAAKGKRQFETLKDENQHLRNEQKSWTARHHERENAAKGQGAGITA